MRIAYLSRGHGFGHAARDLRIINEIRALASDVEINIASSGTGAQYYATRSVTCMDMGIPDEKDQYTHAAWRVWRHLHYTPTPDLVVSDEVMWAIPFCQNILDVPCVLITDWVYSDMGRPEMDSNLNGAAEIILVDFPETHPAAIPTTAKVSHAGPVVTEFRNVSMNDDKISESGLVAVASFGGMTSRPEVRRTLERILDAWDKYAQAKDRLYIMADLSPGDSPLPGVEWVGMTIHPEKYYQRADIVLADGLGFTACELLYNRTPTVTFVSQEIAAKYPQSFTRRIELLASTGATRIIHDETDAHTLWQAIEDLSRNSAAVARARDQLTWAPPRDIAAHLLKYL